MQRQAIGFFVVGVSSLQLHRLGAFDLGAFDLGAFDLGAVNRRQSAISTAIGWRASLILVEPRRIELLTSCVQGRRSPS